VKEIRKKRCVKLPSLSFVRLEQEESTPIVEALAKHPKKWVDFMMRFELGLEKPDPKRAVISAFTIAFAYVAGGLIPLAPYIFAAYLKPMQVATALLFSVALTRSRCWCLGSSKDATPARVPRAALCNCFNWQRGRRGGVSDCTRNFVRISLDAF